LRVVSINRRVINMEKRNWSDRKWEKDETDTKTLYDYSIGSVEITNYTEYITFVK
jgi:hypothetical protein